MVTANLVYYLSLDVQWQWWRIVCIQHQCLVCWWGPYHSRPAIPFNNVHADNWRSDLFVGMPKHMQVFCHRVVSQEQWSCTANNLCQVNREILVFSTQYLLIWILVFADELLQKLLLTSVKVPPTVAHNTLSLPIMILQCVIFRKLNPVVQVIKDLDLQESIYLSILSCGCVD